MLGDGAAGAGRDQRRGGRDVEGRGPAAGPGGVDEVGAGLDRRGERAHRPRQADQLRHRLALRPQGDQEGAGLHLAGPPLHDLGEDRGGVVGGQVVAGADRVDGPGEDLVGHRLSLRRGSSQQLLALRGEDRLGVELHALGRQLAVADAHHDVAVRWRSARARRAGRGRRPASGSGRRPAGSAGRRRSSSRHGRLRRPCRGSARPGRPAAEGLDHRLVAEADAEHRRARLGESADGLDRDPGVGRGAGPRGDDEAVGRRAKQLLDFGAVVADHLTSAPSSPRYSTRL